MGDCNFDRYSKEEKFSYRTWCSMCERGPQRRRSISETNEPCRRKSKELKTLTPKKYNRSQEYENMEFEYELKGQWQEKDMRYEFSRIRSNLCELPTSYISNNCQLSNNLAGLPKLSNESTGFECCKSAGTYETSGKFADIDDQIENLGSMQGKGKSRLEPVKISKIDIPTFQKKSEVRSPDKSITSHSYNNTSPRGHLYSRSDLLDKYPSPIKFKTSSSASPYCNEFCSYSNFKMHTLSNQIPVCFDTSTYFNKQCESIPDKYTREIQDLREKLLSLKSTSYICSDNLLFNPSTAVIKTTVPRSNTNGIQNELKSNTDTNFISNKYKEDKCLQMKGSPAAPEPSPTAALKTHRSKVSLKTRAKLSNHKVRKVKPKTIHNIPTLSDDVNSDCSGSDSENETNLDDEAGNTDENSTDKSDDSSESCTSLNVIETGSGDAVNWPIRQSLFPNIPPYIRFKLHDVEAEVQIPNAKKYFKWKLSTITPLIVRKTLTNTGFVLIRSEFTRGLDFYLIRTFYLKELKLLKQCWEYKNGNGGEMWIIKPPASARGVGIKVINKWSQLPKKSSLIVQKYISNPYLINGSKFDLRLYVLVTSFNPLIIYMYKEGLARTISKLMEYLQGYNVDTKALWRNLQQLVIKTIIACESPVVQLCEENINSRYNCYELFGIDILLDDKLRPWLLEVNISPSLHSASPLDAHVKGPLVQSIFDLAQFHLPSRISALKHGNLPESFDARLYSTALTKREKNKHALFEQLESRDEYLTDILRTLTGDDVRHLIRAEDELTVKGGFERIFPTQQSHRYLHFMEPRYYNRLFDAWEERYGHQREAG
ncbi:unnamed protein product [Diabrotica balteata]|uniref:Tubulin polyglutamylase TTLL4 n=1 Tax=Diabrotica balteata TaxID=107213 RepID=A0A9N9XBI8_DIABA|nr:unnamed protein product [Diabrotica balteata]